MKNWHRFSMAILAGFILFSMTACPKQIETNEPGPGGLPRGIVESDNTISDDGPDFPIYPGAEKKAGKVYTTTDSLDDVVNWYADLLGVEPEITGERGETRTLVTEAYKIVVLSLPSESGGGGVEIHFTLFG